MISPNTALLFAIASLLMAITPGPNMLYLVSRSLYQGRNAGIISLFGIATGFLFHILTAALGLTTLFMTIPGVFTIIKYTGAFYLAYLAFKALKSGNQAVNSIKPTVPYSSARLFCVGLLTNVLNPKMAAFYLSFFLQFVKEDQGSVFLQSLQLGAIQIGISFVVNLIVITGAAKVARAMGKKPLCVALLPYLMASVLIYIAYRLATNRLK